MSRTIRDDEREQQQAENDGRSRMTASQGRGGDGGSESTERRREFNHERGVSGGRGGPCARHSDSRYREPVRVRSRVYDLSPAERQTIAEIGLFRTVAVEDLATFRYAGNDNHVRQDLANLQAQRLIHRRTVSLPKGQGTLAVVVLTQEGKRVARQDLELQSDQSVYAGFVKPNEVVHDAAIYRMYQAEAARIEAEGGSVKRVVLDYELKQKVYSPLAKARNLPAVAYIERQAEIARANGLTVVKGKIPLPDLRIEYETRDCDMAKVDLELATEHYRGSHVKAKASAGFQFYAANPRSSARLTAVFDDHDLTGEILSL